jgi:hypothetical protein
MDIDGSWTNYRIWRQGETVWGMSAHLGLGYALKDVRGDVPNHFFRS